MTRITKLFSPLSAWMLLCLGCTGASHPDVQFEALRNSAPLVSSDHGHRIAALGAFSCDFDIDLTKLSEPLGAAIERDRIFLQRFTLEKTGPDHPGMIQKHIPFTPTSPTAGFAGGRYLFQGREQAAIYEDFIKRRFVWPEGVQFLQRPEFANPECRDWSVVVAWNFVPRASHTAMRTERFDTGKTTLAQELILAARLFALAPSIVAEAERSGYGEVHLVHNLRDHKVQVVYFQPRMMASNPDMPDVAALGQIASAPQLGAPLAALGLTRVFDRSSFVLTIWQPYAAGDHGAPELWPNSPPIPGPFCGDGVCLPSQGESGASCAADCTAQCGDAVCQAGETPARCPSDCGTPFVE